jgi:hypothetical protein
VNTKNYFIVETREQKLLNNRTVQWFLFGDPDYINKLIQKTSEEMTRKMSNHLLYGYYRPEVFNVPSGTPLEGENNKSKLD